MNKLIRTYNSSDKEAVLNLLRLNTPQYFSPDEENDLNFYLENEREEYFVLEINEQVVGSGGINFSDDKRTATISWDILHPGFQKKALGSALLNFRINRLLGRNDIQTITVRTSQLVYKFYEKHGFKIVTVVEDYWASGFHLYQMELSRANSLIGQ